MLESKYLKASYENVQKLMELPMMKDFETWHLQDFLTQSKIRKYKDGEEIIKEGAKDRCSTFFLRDKSELSRQERNWQSSDGMVIFSGK